MGEEVAGIALNILDHTKDGADHDKGADKVERAEVVFPSDLGLLRARSRTHAHAAVEDDGNNNKEDEEGELQEQACNNDTVAGLHSTLIASGGGHKTATCNLVVR
jgi:hypothetical protein